MITNEQQTIIDTIASTDDIVLVSAVAGSGKTSTALVVVDTLKPKKALYTAFNKAIVVEGTSKFTSNVECKTLHALALSYVRPKMKISDFTYLCIKENLSYPDKLLIIDTIDNFFRSASIDMYDYFRDMLTDRLANLAAKYIEGMIHDTVNPTFNFLLKYFHILLVNEDIKVNYDLVILDEIQDSTAVALEIFKLLSSPKKLGLGDPHQAIYGFMNLVNGFEVLTDATVLPLSKSFRCSSNIALGIEIFCNKHIDKSITFTGTDTPIDDGLTAYITSTNAQIVYRLHELHEEGKSYSLTRTIPEIFAALLALNNASYGKEIYHKKYKFLEGEYKNYTISGSKSFFGYLKQNVDDKEIHNAIDVLIRFGKSHVNIFEVLKQAKANIPNPAITVGTAYSLKGLGFSTVYIEDDLNDTIRDIIMKGGPENDADETQLKLYYVAASRCRLHLHNAKHIVLEN